MDNRIFTQHFKHMKRAPNGLVGHLYEHIASRRIDADMMQRGFLPVVDYNFWADIRNATCVFDAFLLTQEAADAFRAAFKACDSSPITLDECERAVIQIGCEHERQHRLDANVLLPQVAGVANAVWLPEREFGYDYEDDKISVEKLQKVAGLEYRLSRPDCFNEVTCEYVFDEQLFKGKPLLKPLAMMLITAIVWYQHEVFNDEFAFYNSDNKWDEGADRVACEYFMTFPRRKTPRFSKIKDSMVGANRALDGPDFLAKMERLLKYNYQLYAAQFYSDKDVHSTTGVIMGGEGWRNVGTVENIHYLLRHLKIRLVDESDELIFDFEGRAVRAKR